MPSWLFEQLAYEPFPGPLQSIGADENASTEAAKAPAIIPILAEICAMSETLERVYCCDPNVQHISKQPNEGGFCGYRNIQMMISYLQRTQSQARGAFGRSMPGVLDLQEMIEEAWDDGIYKHCREQTGGIFGTRKWIGTPEVVSCLVYYADPAS